MLSNGGQFWDRKNVESESAKKFAG
jgi:hypothetical protein